MFRLLSLKVGVATGVGVGPTPSTTCHCPSPGGTNARCGDYRFERFAARLALPCTDVRRTRRSASHRLAHRPELRRVSVRWLRREFTTYVLGHRSEPDSRETPNGWGRGPLSLHGTMILVRRAGNSCVAAQVGHPVQAFGNRYLSWLRFCCFGPNQPRGTTQQ